MSTAAAVATTTTSTPEAVSADPNAFTADELAVMEGKAPANGSAPAAPEARQAPAGASAEPPEKKDGEAEDDAEIEISGDGTVRDLKTGRFVRHEAYLRTKNELKSVKERQGQLEAEVVRGRERLAIFTELSQPAKEKAAPAEPVEINPDEDIFGAFNQLKAENKELRDMVKQEFSTRDAKTETASLNDYVVSDATRFATEKPDFQKALQHALMVQDKIETRMGNTDPAARTQAVNDALRAIVTQSKKSGKSWAETVYNIALDYGYQPEAPAAQQDVSEEAREGIDRINRGQAAAVSMRHSGSGGVPEQLTLSKLASMDEREYLQTRKDYIGKNGIAQWNAFESGKRNY